uniref:Neuron navigator 3 n=1 Tax=Gasterosteus aculeatus TaxID=69293 RepID=G3Q778_GASAC
LVLWLQIYTDWANHYLARSGCQRLIKDLSQDVTDGVLLAQIIQIIANEKVEDINGSPRSQSQMLCGARWARTVSLGPFLQS